MTLQAWSRVSGQREAQGTCVTHLHLMQVRNTTAHAAGPAAGQPREDVQRRRARGLALRCTGTQPRATLPTERLTRENARIHNSEVEHA